MKKIGLLQVTDEQGQLGQQSSKQEMIAGHGVMSYSSNELPRFVEQSGETLINLFSKLLGFDDEVGKSTSKQSSVIAFQQQKEEHLNDKAFFHQDEHDQQKYVFKDMSNPCNIKRKNYEVDVGYLTQWEKANHELGEDMFLSVIDGFCLGLDVKLPISKPVKSEQHIDATEQKNFFPQECCPKENNSPLIIKGTGTVQNDEDLF